jgi:hypothetical protein
MEVVLNERAIQETLVAVFSWIKGKVQKSEDMLT